MNQIKVMGKIAQCGPIIMMSSRFRYVNCFSFVCASKRCHDNKHVTTNYWIRWLHHSGNKYWIRVSITRRLNGFDLQISCNARCAREVIESRLLPLNRISYVSIVFALARPETDLSTENASTVDWIHFGSALASKLVNLVKCWMRWLLQKVTTAQF